MRMINIIGTAVLAALLSSTAAGASTLAIFGNNNIASYYTGLGNTVSIVSDGQIATAGFLDGFDAFIYTRDGYSFGQSLSAAAAANVKSYVTGNIVLFNGDFQDDIGDADTNALFSNALAFVTAKAHGYIGEYRGSFAAFNSDGEDDNAIGLVNGVAGVSGGGQGGSNGSVNVTSIGLTSPLLVGVGLPYNPGAVEYGAQVTGVNPARVLLTFDNGNPALIASGADSISIGSGTPEPATWAMMLIGFGTVGASMRRRATRVTFA